MYVGGFVVDQSVIGVVGPALFHTDMHTPASASYTMLSNRIAHALNPVGPALTVDTACSSSLVSFHHPAQRGPPRRHSRPPRHVPHLGSSLHRNLRMVRIVHRRHRIVVAARIVQGAAGAGMAAQTIAILIASFPRERHSLVFAMYGGVAGFAGMLGPIRCGALLTIDVGGWGWRTVFLINLPIGMVAFALAWRYLRMGRPPSPDRLDLGGAALSGFGLLLIVYALAQIQQHGWQAQPIALALAGVVVTGLFVVHQIKRSARGASPLVRLNLFSDKAFRIGSILICIFFGLFTAFVFAASITMQHVLGYTPWHTAIVMTLFALGAGAGAISSLFLVGRWGILVLAGG